MTLPNRWEARVENRKIAHRKRLPLQGWIWRSLYILYSLEVGIFLLFLPWLGIWENNYWLYRYPQFRPILVNSFLKGAILGLGIANILIGIHEIAQLRKRIRGAVPE